MNQQPASAFPDGVCTYGEDRAPGAGCIRPAGHDGSHCIVPGDPDDDDLCTGEFPGDDLNAGQLCNLLVGHDGSHSALAEVGPGWRRHLTWPANPA